MIQYNYMQFNLTCWELYILFLRAHSGIAERLALQCSSLIGVHVHVHVHAHVQYM